MYEAFKDIDPSQLPPPLRLISLLLQGQADDYEPKVLAQLYELMHSYILNVLQDGLLFAEHADRQQLTTQDIRLAIETRGNLDFILPPSKQV
jgi:transcription initiation factor TFIID subunit 9B